MLDQVAVLTEGFVACSAHKLLFASVDSLVLLQDALMSEDLVTSVARKRHMSFLVALEHSTGVEALTALPTHEQCPPGRNAAHFVLYSMHAAKTCMGQSKLEVLSNDAL